MSSALEGEHYCETHQGNHSHYDAKNCTVCQLEAALLQERENAHAESCRIRALNGRVHAAEAEVGRWQKDYEAAFNRGLKEGNKLSLEQQKAIHAAEAKLDQLKGLPSMTSTEAYLDNEDRWIRQSDLERAFLRGETEGSDG